MMTDRTRAEHMAWCKERALYELQHSGRTDAIASMVSDLGKHPETQGLTQIAAMTGIAAGADNESLRRWIDGFA